VSCALTSYVQAEQSPEWRRNAGTYADVGWPSGFFKAGFSLISHALLAMSNHSGRNFKNLNKTSVVCIELESDLFFAILGSFCREL